MPLPDRQKRKIHILKASDQNPYIEMLIHGAARVGKTIFAATACEVPELSPVLYIDCGNSSDSILGDERFSSINVTVVRNLNDLENIYYYLAPEPEGEGHFQDFKTIIVDELDFLHTKTMREIMHIAHEENSKQDEDVPSMREWGIGRTQILRVVDWFREIPIHLILISSTSYDEKQPYDFMPGLPGQLGKDLSYRISIITYFENKTPPRDPKDIKKKPEMQRIAHFEGSSKYLAGVRNINRAERFNGSLINPTMRDVYNAYYGL